MVYHYTKGWLQKVKKFKRYGRNIYFFRIWPRTVTLTLKRGSQPFRMTLRVMIIHNHTKFHEERLSSWEDIVRTNIPLGYGPSLWPWPWRQQSKIVTPHFGVAISTNLEERGWICYAIPLLLGRQNMGDPSCANFAVAEPVSLTQYTGSTPRWNFQGSGYFLQWNASIFIDHDLHTCNQLFVSLFVIFHLAPTVENAFQTEHISPIGKQLLLKEQMAGLHITTWREFMVQIVREWRVPWCKAESRRRRVWFYIISKGPS